MLNRIAVIFAFVAAFILFTIPTSLPIFAAPAAQSTLPDFTLNAKTVISVTIAISDGQVIVVPIQLTFISQNQDGETDVSLIANADQQAGIFIGVAPSNSISATIQLPQSASAADATPVPGATQTVDGNGTHVANRNSNLRAGPGTNYQVTGNVRKGVAVTVVDQNSNGTWYKLDNGKWIASFLVDPIKNNNTGNNNTGNNNSNNNNAATNGGNEENSQNNAGATNNDDNSNNSNNNSDEETPEPTPAATPTPTATPTPLADQGELTTYVLAISSIGTGAKGAVDSLTDLVGDPQPLKTEWRDSVSSQLAVLSDALDQFLALTPVPGYEDLHSQVTDVALTCEQSLDYLRGGLDDPLTIDPALAMQSTETCANKASDLRSYVQTLQ